VIDASEPDMQDPYARVPGATRNEREAMAKPGATAGVVVIIASTDTPAVTLVTEIAMALADGSAVIVNLPADATRTGRLIGELVLEANIPAGGVSVLSASRPVSRYLATHPDVVSVVVAADMMSPHAVAA
jgi:acyl-CoA reductase-like NAD-dependent aldehyde dehydrogenase